MIFILRMLFYRLAMRILDLFGLRRLYRRLWIISVREFLRDVDSKPELAERTTYCEQFQIDQLREMLLVEEEIAGDR